MGKNHLGPHQDLIVWQKSMDLVVEVYKISGDYPKNEQYGLTSQTRRSAVSIPSNIAEGKRRESNLEYIRFLNIAFGSGAELETQIEIAKRLKYAQTESFSTIDNLLNEVMRMLNTMTRKN